MTMVITVTLTVSMLKGKENKYEEIAEEDS